MAKEELVIEIKVENTATTLADLRRDMDALIATRQELSEKAKAGDSEAAKEVEKLSSAIRNLNTDYKAQQRVLDGYNNSVKTGINTSNLSANSIQENRDLLKQLTAQYIQLKNPSANATSQLKHLSDVLKEQEAAIGNTTRNVGNYKEAIVGAFRDITVGGHNLGGVIDPLKNIANGFKDAGGGAAGLTAGLQQGLLVALPLAGTAISGLVSALSSFEPVAEKIEQLVNGIKAGVQAWFSGGDFFKAASAVAELTAAMQDLEDQQAASDLRAAQGNKEAEQLLLQSRNKSKTLEEQLALVQEANNILSKSNEDSLNQEIEAQKTRERIFQEKFDLNQYDVELLVKGTSRLAKEIKEQRKIEQSAIDEIINGRKKVVDFEAAQISFKEQLANREAAIQEKIEARKEAAEKKRQETLDKLAKDEEEIARKNRENDKLVAEEQEKLKQDEREQLEKEIAETKKLHDQERADEEKAQKEFLDRQNRQAKQSLDDRVAMEAAAVEAKKKIRESELFAARSIAGAFASLSNAVGQQTAAGLVFQKIAAGIQLAINTAESISSAIAGATQAAEAGGPAAPFLIAGYIAGMVGTVISAVSQASEILNSAGDPPAPPKIAGFASGIIGIDGPGTETSDDIPAYLSKNESVMSAKATHRYHRTLAWMEQSVGNSPNYKYGNGMFASGFIPTIVAGDGGFVARDMQRQRSEIDTTALIAALRNLPAPRLDIGEFKKVDKATNRFVKTSEL